MLLGVRLVSVVLHQGPLHLLFGLLQLSGSIAGTVVAVTKSDSSTRNVSQVKSHQLLQPSMFGTRFPPQFICVCILLYII